MKYHRKAILGHFSRGEKFRSKKRSGWFDKTILAAGLLVLTFAAVSVLTKSNTFAEQLGASITIKSFELSRNGNEITTSDTEKSLDYYTAKMVHNTPTNLNLTLDLSLTNNGRTIAAGDTILIPVQTHNADASGSVSDYDLVIDQFGGAGLISNGINIGTFERTSDGILLTFNQNAVGLSSLTDLTLAMNNVARSGGLGYSRVGYITIAGKQFYFAVAQLALNNLSDAAYTGLVTNNNVLWETRVGSDLTNTLSSSRGVQGVATETYVEQDFPGAIDYGTINIREAHRIPVSLNGNSVASIRIATYVDQKGAFTEVKQNSGEIYANFARRVMANPLQYGFFKYDGGIKFIINYGALGVDTPFAPAEEWAEAAADSAISQGYYTAADKQALVNYYLDCFGEDSAIAQSPSSFYNFRMVYEQAIEDTEVSTTAKIFSNDVLSTYNRTATLVGIYGQADVEAKAVELLTIDSKDHTTINGGVYKLQRKVDGEFEDYTPDDGGELEREVTENGALMFKNLEHGIYRIVELEVPEGYDITLSANYDEEAGAAYSDEFTGGSEGVRIIRLSYKEAPEEEPEDTPAAPDTGADTADKLGNTSDAGIYAMTAFGIAMIVIAIKRKISVE